MLNLFLAPLAMAGSALLCCTAPVAAEAGADKALMALIEHDRQAAGTPSPSAAQRVAALERLAKAQGKVLDAQGLVADLGYGAAYAELSADPAILASPHLSARLFKLPAPPRGAENGLVRQVAKSRIETTIAFQGGEIAMIYVRSTDRSPLKITVRSDGRPPICARTSQEGRVLCRWHPERRTQVRVSAALVNPVAGNGVELFTN